MVEDLVISTYKEQIKESLLKAKAIEVAGFNVIVSELDRRITDILHKIEFYNPKSSMEALKVYSRLQRFLQKKRALKNPQTKYIPRTESGNYIIKGKVTDRKRNDLK